MDSVINELFDREKIEYRASLAFSDVRTANERLLAPLGFLPSSVILFLLPYFTGDTENLSCYAASLDYHLGIRDIGGRLTAGLRALFPDAHFSVFGDHSPIDERHAALAAGLGVLGDNGLLINEKYGSYVFIAEILTDLPLSRLGDAETKEIALCPHCGACRTHCPTGILSGKSEKCLSAITQKKGDLTEDEIALIKRYGTVWGCDECQCHCPYNENPIITPIPFFHRERIGKLDRETLDALDEEAFSRRAFAWRGRKTVERNVALWEEHRRKNEK